MNIKEHFSSRFNRIFTYTSKKWYYCLAKTLCIIVGLPLYVVLIPVDMLLFVVYACFSWIPFVNVFMLFVIKSLSLIWSLGYFIAILPDAKRYIEENKQAEKAAREKEEFDESSDGVEYQIRQDAENQVQPNGENTDKQSDVENVDSQCDVENNPQQDAYNEVFPNVEEDIDDSHNGT